MYSLELLGGGEVGRDGVGDHGKAKEQPLEPNVRLSSANAIRIYLIFFSILPARFNYITVAVI